VCVCVCACVRLDGTISSNQHCDKNIERHIGLAAEGKGHSKATKIVMYKALVLSILVCNTETSTV